MTDNSVYEVIEETFSVIGGTSFREGTERTDEKSVRYFYTTLQAAKGHLKYWAKVNHVQYTVRDWSLSRTDEKHPNDWNFSIPEFEVKKIYIRKHELRGYFWIDKGMTA